MRNKPIPALLFLTFILSACSSLAPTPTVIPTASLIPTATVTPLPTAPNTPTPTPAPALERAQYTLDTTIDYDAHTVTVNEKILYPNFTGKQLNTLVIAVVLNLWAGSFTLTGLSLNGTPITTYTLDGQRLDIALPDFFKPNASLYSKQVSSTVKVSPSNTWGTSTKSSASRAGFRPPLCVVQ